MWCKVCISYEPSYKNNGDAEIQFAVRYFRPNESALYKLCTNINQPYLIQAAVLSRHVPPTKDQGFQDQQSTENPTGQSVDLYIVHDVVVVVVVVVVVGYLELLQI